MKERLRRALEEFLRHLDSYVTIIAAAIVAGLSFWEVLPPSRIASLTLAVLAVLAYTMLAGRHRGETAADKLDRLQDQLGKPACADDFFQPIDRWPSVPALLERCQELVVTGKDLHLFLTRYLSDLQGAVHEGKRLRFLLVAPDDPHLLRILSAGGFVFAAPGERKGVIEHSLLLLRRLVDGAPKDHVQVRLVRFVPTVSYLICDGSQESGEMTVTLYGYKVARADRRHIVLTRARDPDTFALHYRQFETIWRDAEPL
jgi:hypothetical protein